jgi:carbonic anhydrase
VSVTPDDALKSLIDGNARYVSKKAAHAHQDSSRRVETFTDGQHPIVSVLGCADSRVPPEILFDQGIGDIFTVRVAGNVADVDEIGTLEYGAGHLGIPLIVVLGHTKCGAVTAVVKKEQVSENIGKLVDNIVPAVNVVLKANPTASIDDQVKKSITANVKQSIEDILKNSKEIAEFVEAGKVKIVGALYDIESGKVQIMGTHPDQQKILSSLKREEVHQQPVEENVKAASK